jgi:NTE family protein
MTQIQWRSTGAEPPRRIALALQGGGSHGAFTWGVLDRLLEDESLEIGGVTGAGAGAMNAVVLADGLLRGGREQAREGLRTFWHAIGEMPGFGALTAPLAGRTEWGVGLEQTPAYLAWDLMSRNFSPSQLNPLNFNPLRSPLQALVDFERLQAVTDLPVMVCATNVRTGRRSVFSNPDLSVDAVLASACLPHLFPPVMIDGEPYWHGGFTGNPALIGFLQALPRCDLLIVRSDPVERDRIPVTPREVQDRIVELSFNSSFWLELSAAAAMLRLTDQGLLDRERFGRILFHSIDAHPELERIAASSKVDTSPSLLTYLFGLGRDQAEEWLGAYGSELGHRSTVDLQQLLPVGDEPLRRAEFPTPVPAEAPPLEYPNPRVRFTTPEAYG